MQFGKLASDREAETGTFANAARARANLIEPVKNVVLFLWRDADSRVADRDMHETASFFAFDPDQPTFGREFHGIAPKAVEQSPVAEMMGGGIGVTN